MTDQFELDAESARMPCRNRCTYPESENLRPATVGAYCDREYNAIHWALKRAPLVVEHLVTLKGASETGPGERVDASKDAPVPINVAAFDMANEIYSTLVYWCLVVGEEHALKPPAPAVGSRLSNGQVQGLPPDVGHSTARYMTGVMSMWLQRQTDLILSQSSEDVDEITQSLRFVYQADARFPQQDRPRFADVPCPDAGCGGRIAVYPPRDFGDDQLIVCEKCSRVFPESDFAFLVRVFEESRRELARSARVSRHLERKYAG